MLRFAAMFLILLTGAGGASLAATPEPQTDWYGRGIIRQQTIGVRNTRQKRRHHDARQKRRARKQARAHKH